MDELDVPTLVTLFAEQSSENAVLLTNIKRQIQWLNRTCEQLFGYAANELEGRLIDCLFTSEDRDKQVPEYEFAVAARSEDMNNDRWMQRANGSQFWATGNTVGLRNRDGKVIGFAKIIRDSSDVKEQIETLRNQVKVLADSNQHKTLFLARLSHEMRNPLSALSSTLELVKNRSAADALPAAAGIFERQLNQLYRLADDLLDVTRISTGKVSIQLQLLDVKEPIATAVETVQPLIQQKRHRLVQHILQTPITVQADRTRLEQVFINLLTNAARYTPEGGEIEVRASSDEKEALVHVIDNGMGIDADIQPHVFELFTRGDDAAAYAQDGLGIGLSLVKKFVELQGGSVQVRSDGAGKGSAFTVHLPLAESTDAPAQ